MAADRTGNPYTAPASTVRRDPTLGEDGQAVAFIDLPRICPRCGGKVRKPMKFQPTPAVRWRNTQAILAAIGVGIASSLLQVVVLRLWSLWLAFIPAILVSIAIRKSAQRLPKLGIVTCSACRWDELYLIRLPTRR